MKVIRSIKNSFIGNELLLKYFFLRHEIVREIRFWRYSLLKKAILGNLSIEISSNCNLNCVQCPHNQLTHKANMDLKLFKRILNYLSNDNRLKTKQVSLFNFGEPLMHPEFHTLLAIIKDWKETITHSPRFVITTNATLLNKLTSRQIIDSGSIDEIYFSVDGGNKNDFERMRPGAKWGKVLNNIDYFLEYKNLSDFEIKTGLITIIDKKKPDFDQAFLNLVSQVDIYNKRGYHNWDGSFDSVTSTYRNLIPSNRFCNMIMTFLVIHSNGNTYPCCVTNAESGILGNVFDKSLYEIYFSDKMEKIIASMHKHERQKLPFCRKCQM